MNTQEAYEAHCIRVVHSTCVRQVKEATRQSEYTLRLKELEAAQQLRAQGEELGAQLAAERSRVEAAVQARAAAEAACEAWLKQAEEQHTVRKQSKAETLDSALLALVRHTPGVCTLVFALSMASNRPGWLRLTRPTRQSSWQSWNAASDWCRTKQNSRTRMGNNPRCSMHCWED